MSKQLIDDWLDHDLHDHAMEPLEDWLREEPKHMRQFFDAVTLHESMHAHYGSPSRLSIFRVPCRNRRWMLASLVVAATLMLAVIYQVLLIPELTIGRPSTDPLVWIVSGNPQVVSVRIHVRPVPDRPQPVPFPIGQPPMSEQVTRVTTAESGSVVRWGDDCVLASGPGTILALKQATSENAPETDGAANKMRSLTLTRGTLTVRLATEDHAIDVMVGATHVTAMHPATFVLVVVDSELKQQSAILSVTDGTVNVWNSNMPTRTVAAGESITLPHE